MEKKVNMITTPSTKTFDEACKETGRSRTEIDALCRLHESDPNVLDYGFLHKVWAKREGVDGKMEDYEKKTGKVLINNERYKNMLKYFKEKDEKKGAKPRKKYEKKKYAQ